MSRRIKEVVTRIRKECERENLDATVLFLDLNWVLRPDMFGRDGIHLNEFGTQRLGKEIISLIRVCDHTRMGSIRAVFFLLCSVLRFV